MLTFSQLLRMTIFSPAKDMLLQTLKTQAHSYLSPNPSSSNLSKNRREGETGNTGRSLRVYHSFWEVTMGKGRVE